MKPLLIGSLFLTALLGHGAAQIVRAEETQRVKDFCDQSNKHVQWLVQQRDAGLSKRMAWRKYKKRHQDWNRHMRSYWKEAVYWVYVYPDMTETEIISDAHFFCLAFPPKL